MQVGTHRHDVLRGLPSTQAVKLVGGAVGLGGYGRPQEGAEDCIQVVSKAPILSYAPNAVAGQRTVRSSSITPTVPERPNKACKSETHLLPGMI